MGTDARAKIRHQPPVIVWITGPLGAGQSIIANLVEAQLHARDVHTIVLDGDNIRRALNNDLALTDADCVKNIRRIGEVAKRMTEAALIVPAVGRTRECSRAGAAHHRRTARAAYDLKKNNMIDRLN